MSVCPNDIVIYGCANMPEADSATVGGAVDFTKLMSFVDVSPTGTLDAVSSSASDTATKLQVTGRDASGSVVTPTAITLTGTTPVTAIGSSQSFERVLSAVISGGAIGTLTNPGGTAAVGDVALYAHTALISGHTAQTGAANTSGTTPPLFKLQSGDGASVAIGDIIRIKTNTGANQLRTIVAASGYGTDIVAVNRDWSSVPDNTSTYDVYQGLLFTISPNAVTAITRIFVGATADVLGGSTRTFYEKGFVVNNNTTITLQQAQVEVASDSPSLPGSALLDLALCTALNDTNTIASRQASAPSGIGSFTTQPAYIATVANTLPSGSAPNTAGAQGMWFRLTLPAGTTVYKGAATVRTNGSTT